MRTSALDHGALRLELLDRGLGVPRKEEDIPVFVSHPGRFVEARDRLSSEYNEMRCGTKSGEVKLIRR